MLPDDPNPHDDAASEPAARVAHVRVPFSTQVESEDGRVVVAVSGEIDPSTSKQMADAIEEVAAGARVLIIDLAGVTFIDSTGIGVLVQAFQLMGERKDALVLRAPSPSARRLLQITALDQIITIEGGG